MRITSNLPLRAMALAALSIPLLAFAQTYPTRPVRLVVPFAAGGGTDLLARTVGQKVGEVWKQSVVIDNRAGAGGNLGADVVAKSTPDGYTLLVNITGLAISASLYKSLPFDVVKDFTPIVHISSSALVLVANNGMPSTVKELVALAKSQPGKINYGSTGLGAPPHLAGELLGSMAGVSLVHIPYKGDAPMIPALIANEIQIGFIPQSAALPHVRSGKLRAIAVAAARRASNLPDVPTVIESGIPNFDLTGWTGVFGPAGLSRDVVAQIHDAFAKVLADREFVEKMRGMGFDAAPPGTPDEFAARVKADVGVYAKIVRDAKVPLID